MNDELIDAIDELIGSIDELTESVSEIGGDDSEGDEKEGKSGGWREQISGAVGAITGVSSEMLKLLGVIAAMVAAINPSTFQAFQQALLDLTATVGSAFVPVLQIATSAIREISGIVLPLVQQLQPLLQELANAIADRVVAGFRLLTSIIQALYPVIELVVYAFTTLLDVQTALINVLTVVVRTLASFFGSVDGAKDFFKQIADTLKMVIRELVLFGAMLAQILGFTEFVGRLKDNFEKLAAETERRDAGLVAAARNPAIESIDSIGKKFQMASLVAAGEGGAREKSDSDLFKEIAKGLGDITKTSPDEWKSKIKSAILEAGRELLKELPGGKTIEAGGAAIKTVTDRSATTGSRFRSGREAGGLIGGGLAAGAGLAGDAWDAPPDVF